MVSSSNSSDLFPPPTADNHEKPAMRSKKFAAFALTELGFFIIMSLMVLRQGLNQVSQNLAFMVIAVTAGFLAVGYILGQAYTDRYVRVAFISMGKGHLLSPAEKEANT
jgi:glucan phosphoethanolaminetransferase (alkaline phosphatase superfamily)